MTRRGEEMAVLVPISEWHRMQRAAPPTLKSLLLSDDARAEIPVPARGMAPRRALPLFE